MKLTKQNGHYTMSLKSLEAKERNLTYVKLGEIMLREAGLEACQKGYGTTDPEWVGRYALSFGDINRDGTTN